MLRGVTMPQRLIERALRVWRDAERLLATLDDTSSDAARVRRAMSEAQSAYSSLVDEPDVTPELLERSRQMVEEAEAALHGIEPAPSGNAA